MTSDSRDHDKQSPLRRKGAGVDGIGATAINYDPCFFWSTVTTQERQKEREGGDEAATLADAGGWDCGPDRLGSAQVDRALPAEVEPGHVNDA